MSTTRYLNRNLIGDAGIEAIAAALPKSEVAELYVGLNQIGVAGAAALAAALPASGLRWLRLSSNRMGDAGTAIIARALPASPRLTWLRMGGSNVGGGAGRSKLLAEHGGGLGGGAQPGGGTGTGTGGGTSFGDGGAAALAAALPLSRLRYLGISGNQITDRGAEAIAGALPACRHLRYLSMAFNPNADGVGGAFGAGQGWIQQAWRAKFRDRASIFMGTFTVLGDSGETVPEYH